MSWYSGNTGATSPPNYDAVVFVSADGEDPVIDFSEWASGVQVTKTDVDRVGEFLVDRRKGDTLAGISSSGEPFQEYSPSYERRKRQANVDLYGHDLSPRHMVDALTFRSYAELRDTRGAVQIGIEGGLDLITRARIHEDGLVFRNAAYRRMLPSGEFMKRQNGTRLRTSTKIISMIPARPWMKPSEQDISDATEVFLESVWGRLGSKGNRRNIPSRLPNFGKVGFRPNYLNRGDKIL